MAVVDLLRQPRVDVREVARSTLSAAEQQLASVPNDPGVGYCFWLLGRITTAARGDDFEGEMSRLGLPVTERTSTLSFASAVADRVREQFAVEKMTGSAAQVAVLSLGRAISDTVGQSQVSLLDSSVEDLRRSLRQYSTRAQFGEISQRFFGDFLARTLKSAVDRELPVVTVAGDPSSNSIRRIDEALGAIDLHARQSAAIVRGFAGGWYSKHNWETRGQISRGETDRFVAYAMRKLRMELQREAGA
ncbi:MAG: hypothetical protein HY875_10610 [Chloroflexi bacterium]|nr:hypothetical protein [Chloroflexota bacterium]